MFSKLLQINLFGACVVRSATSADFEITGTKHKALFALLATAPFGRRTRAYLQDTLWGTACYDTGRQSLRRALSDIKQVMGGAYSELISATNSEIALDLSKVEFIGRPGHGEFLEGIDVKEVRFNEWLRGIRQNPQQIFSLYSRTNGQAPKHVTPVVAVIPFRLIVGPDDNRVLADWLAEEVCRSLSRSNLLTIISHLSSRRFSAKLLDLSEVRSTLGVDYFVSGSMRALDGTIIIDADFVDARSGQIVWTRQFSGTLDTFIRDAGGGIAEIVGAVGRALADEALKHVRDRHLAELEDHKILLAGVSMMHGSSLGAIARSRELLNEAVARAPHSAEGYAWLAKWHVLNVLNGWSTDPVKDKQTAVDLTARALDINPDSAFCLTIDGQARSNLMRELDVAAMRYEQALNNNPNEALSWLLSGTLHAFTDNAEDAIAAVDKARQLSPIDPFGYFYDSLSATAYLAGGKYEAALDLANRSLLKNSRHLSTLRVKIGALHKLGRTTELRAAGAQLLRRQPDCTVSSYLRGHPAADYESGRNIAAALRAAGIPD